MCIKVGWRNNPILWCTVEKTSNYVMWSVSSNFYHSVHLLSSSVCSIFFFCITFCCNAWSCGTLISISFSTYIYFRSALHIPNHQPFCLSYEWAWWWGTIWFVGGNNAARETEALDYLNLNLCHSVHQNFNIEYPGLEPSFLWWQTDSYTPKFEDCGLCKL